MTPEEVAACAWLQMRGTVEHRAGSYVFHVSIRGAFVRVVHRRTSNWWTCNRGDRAAFLASLGIVDRWPEAFVQHHTLKPWPEVCLRLQARYS